MIVLGLILLIIGLVANIPILTTIGAILLVVGLILNIVPIGGTPKARLLDATTRTRPPASQAGGRFMSGRLGQLRSSSPSRSAPARVGVSGSRGNRVAWNAW